MHSFSFYKLLIQQLPVNQQSFIAKAKAWESQLNKTDFDYLFQGESILELNRQNVHDTNDIYYFLLKVILWGYPRGMRGNHFANIYKDLQEMSLVFNEPERKRFSLEDLTTMQSKLKKYTGLGLSTYSKMLYFRDFSFDGNPAVILDERIIRVINKGIFQELDILRPINSYNAMIKYAPYIKLMNELAQQLDTKPENIEQFLFLFGNNLKK